MARVPNVVPRERALRPLMRAVHRVAAAHTFCAKCGSPDVRRSLSRTPLDVFLACLLLVPFRCRMCRERYYRFWRPSFRQAAEAPLAPVLMMPRQLHEIDPVESDLVEPAIPEVPVAQPERHLPHLVEPQQVVAPAVRLIRSRSILILESDLSIRKLLRRLLDRRGYFTHEVSRPEDLSAELRDRRVDLLVVDAALLGANGLDAAFALAPLYPNLKILALSSESVNGGQVRERCLALTKPFSLESFLGSVDRLLEPADPPDHE